MRMLFLLIFISACGSPEQDYEVTNLQSGQTGSQSFNGTECRAGKINISEALTSPKTIKQAIDLINALPKPVTIPCFLSALKRPLYLNATNSVVSVQPAVGNKSPRLFIKNDSLIMGFAFAGDGSQLLEFGELISDAKSIKGELLFPIDSEITYSAPYDRIKTTTGTTCAGCHANEYQDTTQSDVSAFISVALKPDYNRNVYISEFFSEHTKCVETKDYSHRCKMIYSLFNNGKTYQKYFPSNMPTYFESLGF